MGRTQRAHHEVRTELVGLADHAAHGARLTTLIPLTAPPATTTHRLTPMTVFSPRLFLAICLSVVGGEGCAATATPPESPFPSLRAAVLDLSATFGPEYPRGRELIARLERLEHRVQSTATVDKAGIESDTPTAHTRLALLNNPFACNRCPLRDPPPVCTGPPRHRHHVPERRDQYRQLSRRRETSGDRPGPRRPHVDHRRSGRAGLVRDPDVRFDARRIVLSHAPRPRRRLPHLRGGRRRPEPPPTHLRQDGGRRCPPTCPTARSCSVPRAT